MPSEVVVIGLIALAGFLLGGVYTTWKTAKGIAMVLLAAAVLAAGGAAVWWFSL
ncbi:hypothetical protein [Haloechinothrix halophila]|uniref:hypothetical protein n=1 Tax=Haloechinothrix halophila TaxID=1069073 RepID=UPI0004246C60|nr:hypothetical protein [Haloechinothrix halophila]